MSVKRFRIAFSFAGEKRDFVKDVAAILATRFSKEVILYDKFHEAEFARYDLGIYLPKFYREQSDLVVAVFSQGYDKKRWTGWEWMAIHAQLTKQEGSKVMLTRFDYANPDGLFENAAFVELDAKSPEQFATLILERLALNEGNPKDHYTNPVTTNAKLLSTSATNNLPRLPLFFGREEELKRIQEALDPMSSTWGMLIDGEGGRGKTALAVRAAELCPPNQFSRIIFLSARQRVMDEKGIRDLGGFALHGWGDMRNEIGRRLDRPEIAKEPEATRSRLLCEVLTGSRSLILLDNLESFREADLQDLRNFVEHLPRDCKALLTSRTPLGFTDARLPLKKLDRVSALECLADLAKHNERLAESSEADRIELYEQAQGNPLLLRWVAGQVGQEDRTTLVDALAFLRTCPPDNDPLDYIFGDLLRILSEEHVLVLAVLTYPDQAIPVEAIAEISGVLLDDTRRVLKMLANRSLVIPDKQQNFYALVPMVADFLRKKNPGGVEETGDRLEQRAYALIVENGYEKHDRFPLLDAAWPTVAPALPLFLAGPNPRLQTVCTALRCFLEFTGRWDESLSLSKDAESKAKAFGDESNAGSRAHDAGWVHYLRQEADDVLRCAENESTHQDAAKASARERASAIRLRGLGHRLKKDYPSAIDDYDAALKVYASQPADTEDVAIVLNYRGEAERLSRNFDAAEKDYRSSLKVAVAVGFDEGVACFTGDLAELALDRKDWPEAETLAREALLLTEIVGRQELIAKDCLRLALAIVRQGQAAEALPHARRAVDIFAKLGSPRLADAQAVLRECES